MIKMYNLVAEMSKTEKLAQFHVASHLKRDRTTSKTIIAQYNRTERNASTESCLLVEIPSKWFSQKISGTLYIQFFCSYSLDAKVLPNVCYVRSVCVCVRLLFANIYDVIFLAFVLTRSVSVCLWLRFNIRVQRVIKIIIFTVNSTIFYLMARVYFECGAQVISLELPDFKIQSRRLSPPKRRFCFSPFGSK